MHATTTNLGGEPVARGWEQARAFLAEGEMILGAVDERLRVFDAEADGEGLGL
jgi:hypothetical protein